MSSSEPLRKPPAVRILSDIEDCKQYKMLLESMLPPDTVISSTQVVGASKEFLEETLQNVEVAVANPRHFSELLKLDILLPNLRWVQFSWAGTDKIMPILQQKQLPFVITRFSGDAIGQLISEYVVAQLITWERGFRRLDKHQEAHLWRPNGMADRTYRSLNELTFGILGVGEIGKRLVQTLRQYRVPCIKGFGRSSKDDSEWRSSIGLDEYFHGDSLKQFLTDCHVLVGLLPHTTDTAGLLDGDALQVCAAKKPLLINVGRGSLIHEADLISALDAQWIQGAILDVFEIEPLPPNSRLWDRKDVVITPHISAVSRPQDVCEFFAKNYRKYTKGETLECVLDVEKGY